MKKAVIILALSIVTAIVISCRSVGPTQQAGLAPSAATPSTTIKATGYVTDDAKVLDGSTQKQLETILAALKERKKIDFAVVIVSSTGDKSVRDQSLALARERKNNSIEKNVSGLLLLVAVDDRNWHIQITRNLEAQLTPEILTNLSTLMTDSFREKQYGAGIIKYVNAIIAKLEPLDVAWKAQKTQKIVLAFRS
jgi:uncharacterized membrane protein YgcG